MKTKKNYLEAVEIILPVVLALICVFSATYGNIQAGMPIPMPQSFIGEYSYDEENWFPITDDAEISALDGELYLRGHFEREMFDGQLIRYYQNHIGVTIFVNGELLYLDAVTELADGTSEVFSSMCGQTWASVRSPGISEQDAIEIHLYNPHRLGNESAYRDFLMTLCGEVEGPELLAKNLEEHGEVFRFVGSVCAIISLMIMGAAVASVIVRIPVGGKLLKEGLLVLFVGGFIFFDTIDVSFRSELIALNTYALQVSMMLAAFFAGLVVGDSITGRRRTVAKTALGISSVLNAAMIMASLAGVTVIYDTLPLWTLSQLILCPMFIVFCAIELLHAPRENRLMPFSGLLLFSGILLDLFGVFGDVVWRNPCSKILFVVLVIVHIIEAACDVVRNYRAQIRAEKLEKELENSRISIMLSQIQPHFLYNVLGTIRGLCREDPMQARQALGDFSDYLRGNMNALANSNMIHFTSELRHIEAYLRLEKMRMGGKLNILYDIREKSFFIPPLTIQPLVENAVKHGLFEKGGGTLIMHTRREGEHIFISVQDDGVGFDKNAPLRQDDHHAHVGLINVRSRLEKMSDGVLTIDSTPGKGTTVTVMLRNDLVENGGGNSYEHTGHR